MAREFAATFLGLLLPCVAAVAASCESLMSLSIKDASITSAQPVAAGTADFSGLPAFCRVSATLKPTSDSDINVEIWLPMSDWNGKYQALGNGGWFGAMDNGGMAYALARGYAASSTDTGHEGGSASFALGHPEKLIDYAYRSEHEMAVKAKAIITAFYGRAPRVSYWNGCSAGGRQALKEAQRFPEDFDGILAGAPGYNWSGRAAHAVWVAQAVHRDQASYIPPYKYSLIHNAVLEACDALDGVKDGVLEDPTRCAFDPVVLQCKDVDSPACLTAPQVEAARKIYASVINPRTKQEIFPGLEPGSELDWGVLAGPRLFSIANDFFKYVIFRNPSWDYRTFNFDQDMDYARKVDNGTIDAVDPDLKRFFQRGGKLLQYHGWSDWQIAPLASVRYYQSVVNALGRGRVQDSYRLFMVPGMGHCGGGEGPSRLDLLSPLEDWVERGKAPVRIIGFRSINAKDRTRPLCPYPQVAKYKGSGSTDDAADFTCVAP